MSCHSNPATAQQWADRFLRFTAANQTVAEFCRREGVSQASFYQWRKKLAIRQPARESETTPANASRSTIPAMPGNRSRTVSALRQGTGFKPVQISNVEPATAMVTIRLSSGTEIELGDDPRLIEVVFRQILQAEQLTERSVRQSNEQPERGVASC